MPIPDDLNTIVLGLAATLSYMICYGFVTYRYRAENNNEKKYNMLASEGIFLLCINLLGLFTRLTKEIAIRTTFLDRRQCVEENLLLRYARDQEVSFRSS